MTAPVPIPKDFATTGMQTDAAVAAQYNVNRSTVQRWRKQTGVRFNPKGVDRTPITSAKLEAIRKGIAAGLSAREVGEQIGMMRKTVLTHARKYGLGKWQTSTGREAGCTIPPDFDAFYLANSSKICAERFGVCDSTIRSWAHMRDISKGRSQPKPRPSKPKPPRETNAASVHKIGHKPTPFAAAKRDLSREGQAADYLRKYGPVVRCDERGRYAEDGAFYRRGSSVLTGEEIVSRAVRNGWDADAWMRVA